MASTELLLGTHLPGIFASRTRRVGDGFSDIRSWGTIRVEILEMERLRPMSPEPSSSQIIHMAFVILAFSSAGILTRDLNKHNWGIRRFSSDGVIQELVAIDGADWHQEGGPTLSSPPPSGVMVEMDRRGGPSHGVLASQPGREIPPGPCAAGDGPVAEAPSA